MWMKLKSFLEIGCLALLLAAGSGGCRDLIIGSWPQPEGRESPQANSETAETTPVVDDPCDGVDNDADGVTDEGCECSTAEPRGCTVFDSGVCQAGFQYCVQGFWGGCDESSESSDAQVGELSFESVTPANWNAASEENLVIVTRLDAPCDGIVPVEVGLQLRVDTPAMSVWYSLRDGGTSGDVAAFDGLYSIEIVNPFGPGVTEQRIYLEAATRIDGRVYSATSVISPEVGQ